MRNPYDNSQPDALERIFQKPLNWMNLIIICLNILIFAGMRLTGGSGDTWSMLRWGACYTPLILSGEWYRLFSGMFLHFSLMHLLNNMLLLLFMGDMLEEITGHWKYLLIYLGGGLFGNLITLFVEYRTGELAVSAGASGAVYAVIGAVLVVALKNRGRGLQAMASRLFLIIIFTVYYGFRSAEINNAAHIGGVLGGMMLTFVLYHPKRRRMERHRREEEQS